MRRFALPSVFVLCSLLAFAEGGFSVKVIPKAEAGLLYVAQHSYQSGADGTLFDYVKQGGQDILFPYQRFSAEAVLGGQNRITFVYQPLTLDTKTVVDRNSTNGGTALKVDGVSFPVGTEVDLRYGFDFWRASWLYDFFQEDDTLLGAGISLQIRNASISFTSSDGTLRTVQQNIGPVPILKARFAKRFGPEFFVDVEGDGFYASSAIFNGSGKEFEGWIWDASVTVGTELLAGVDAFLSLRTIGGGARGNNAYSYVSSTTSTPGSYTYNALATFAVSLGATLRGN